MGSVHHDDLHTITQRGQFVIMTTQTVTPSGQLIMMTTQTVTPRGLIHTFTITTANCHTKRTSGDPLGNWQVTTRCHCCLHYNMIMSSNQTVYHDKYHMYNMYVYNITFGKHSWKHSAVLVKLFKSLMLLIMVDNMTSISTQVYIAKATASCSFFPHFWHTMPFTSLSFLWAHADIFMIAFICSVHSYNIQWGVYLPFSWWNSSNQSHCKSRWPYFFLVCLVEVLQYKM